MPMASRRRRADRYILGTLLSYGGAPVWTSPTGRVQSDLDECRVKLVSVSACGAGGQGGALSAENRAEGGSRFHLLVPAATASSSLAQPLASASPTVTRILLVEDDESV